MTQINCGDDANCNGPNCCTPRTSRNSPWKTIAFVVVILAAVTVAAYSMLTRGTDGGCSTPCGNILSVEAWNEKLSGYDFAFVVLLGSDQSLPEELSESVVSASIKIESKKLRTRTLILHPDNPGFAEATNLFKVAEYPVVIALAKSNSVVVTRGTYSETELMRAYEQASAVSCCPSSGPK
ncbi:MAG: hypothetical protein KKG33_01820 [candidate division Zixibacteria bacterium]|nr:hypothetical protein [candidate division Zixibacteria bacterium]MBU1470899.1 hypothetical protein [candidate division Zixibacteria bacterium]MBU2624277.1 hypothetical protein [candidate division Zixibacteria bacterium]